MLAQGETLGSETGNRKEPPRACRAVGLFHRPFRAREQLTYRFTAPDSQQYWNPQEASLTLTKIGTLRSIPGGVFWRKQLLDSDLLRRIRSRFRFLLTLPDNDRRAGGGEGLALDELNFRNPKPVLAVSAVDLHGKPTCVDVIQSYLVGETP